MPAAPLNVALVDRFFEARRELASIYISPSLIRKSEAIILSAGKVGTSSNPAIGLAGLCVGSYCGLLMASKGRLSSLLYATSRCSNFFQ